MKRVLTFCLIFSIILSTTACSAPTKVVGGVEYRDYGFFNRDEVKNPNIFYEPNWWNITLAIVFCELIIPPIYVFGYHCMKPVGPKPSVQGATK